MLQEVVRDAAARAVASASSAPAKLQSLHHVEDDVGSLLSEISLQATAGGDVISEHAQCHTHVAVTLETHRGYAFANLRCGHELASAAEHENTDPAAVTNPVQSLFLPLPLPPPRPLKICLCLSVSAGTCRCIFARHRRFGRSRVACTASTCDTGKRSEQY